MPTATITKKKTAKRKTTIATNGRAKKSARGKDLSASYNQFKEFEGRQYTGMQVGRSHNWNYDKRVWKETKITRLAIAD